MNQKLLTILFLIFTTSLFAQRRDLIKSDPDNIDIKLFRSINNLQCGFLSTVIPVTDKSLIFTSTLVPAGIFAISRSNKNFYDENSAVLLGLSEGLSAGITYGLKTIIRRKRPFETLQNVHYNRNKFLLDKYSFPSGHTSMSFSAATSLTLRYPDKPVLIAGAYLYSTVIAFGRIYQGVHYPTDVLAGVIIGSGSAALVYSLRKEIIKGKNNLFRESGREDINSKSVSGTLILTTFILSDAVNYISERILQPGKKSRITFDLRGNESNFNFIYNF